MTHGDPRAAFFDHHAHGWDSDAGNTGMLHRLGHMRERLGLTAGMRVLEVGCGTGLITGWLIESVGANQVVSVDFSSEMLAKARAKGLAADFRQVDICQQSPAQGEFDLALCFQSFPHFRDKPAAMGNLANSLKPQGRLVVLHFAGSEKINSFHRQVGGAVGCDLLPERDEWSGLVEKAGLRLRALEDREDLFLMEAGRS
jgi:2-polyprenyl-3-methyl-5-hydroxy-6-metoxy-1,4-benzoquinol methylase